MLKEDKLKLIISIILFLLVLPISYSAINLGVSSASGDYITSNILNTILSDYVPYTGANNNLNLGENELTNSEDTSFGSSSSFPAPASGSVTFNYGVGDWYVDYALGYTFRIYAYKEGVYSQPLEITGYDDGTGMQYMKIALTWDAVSGADNYKIVIYSDDYSGIYNNYYYETTSTSLIINDPLGYIVPADPAFVNEDPIVVTPNLVLTEHEFVGNVNIGGETNISGDLSVGGDVGIGTNEPISPVNIYQETTGKKGITITGYGLASTSPYSTEGVGMYLNYNGVGNRQLLLGATDSLGSSTTGLFRFLTGATGYSAIDSVTGDGLTRLLTILGTDTTGVTVGYGTSHVAQSTAKLNVFTRSEVGSQANVLLQKFGTASGNYLEVKNSAGTSLSSMSANGYLAIGYPATPFSALHVDKATTIPGNGWGSMVLTSNDAVGINKGGTLSFGGKYSGVLYADWAGIGGLKETATSGQYGGYLSFYTRTHGSSTSEKMRITSDGKVGIGVTTPIQALDIKGRGYLRQAVSSSPLAWDFVKSDGTTMATFFVAGAENQFLNGAVAGDSGFRAMGGKFLLGAGPTAGVEPEVSMIINTDGEVDFKKAVEFESNITLETLLKLTPMNLPTCDSTNKNSIGANATGTYGCDGSAWVRIF